MDFSSIIYNDETLKSIVKIKYYPYSTCATYIENLPDTVRLKLAKAFFGHRFNSFNHITSVDLSLVIGLKRLRYPDILEQALLEYEFQQSFKKE